MEALVEGQKEEWALGEIEALAEGHNEATPLSEWIALADKHDEATLLSEWDALAEGRNEATPLSEEEALIDGHDEATPLAELEGLQPALPEGLRLLPEVALAVPLPPLAELLGLLVPVGAYPVPDVLIEGGTLPQKVPLPVGEPQLDAVGEAVAAVDRVGAVTVAPALAEWAEEAVLITLSDAHALAEPEGAAVALAAALPVKGDGETVSEGGGVAMLLTVPVADMSGVDEPPPLRGAPSEPDELPLREASAALGEGQAEGERLTGADGERECVPEALPLVDGEAVEMPLALCAALRETESHAEELALAQDEAVALGLFGGLGEGEGLPLPRTEAVAGAGLLLPLGEGLTWLPLVVTLPVARAEKVGFAVALPKTEPLALFDAKVAEGRAEPVALPLAHSKDDGEDEPLPPPVPLPLLELLPLPVGGLLVLPLEDPLEDAVAWEGVALGDPCAEAVSREAEAAPLPQGLGDALALSGEREVRALHVPMPEAHDDAEGLLEKEAQEEALSLPVSLWEPELQREGQLEAVPERDGALEREAPLAVCAPDAQALAEKVRDALGLPVPLGLPKALLEPEEQGVAEQLPELHGEAEGRDVPLGLPDALMEEEGQGVGVRLAAGVAVLRPDSVALPLLERHFEAIALEVTVRELEAHAEVDGLRVPHTVALPEPLAAPLPVPLPL
jgi:hypothetical protein